MEDGGEWSDIPTVNGSHYQRQQHMVGGIPSWAPKAGGRGGRVPAVEKSAGDVPPRNEVISETFLFTRTKILHFPAFSK